MPSGKSGTANVGQLAASGSATLFVANNISRINLIITNGNTTADAVIGYAATVNATNGFVVRGGSSLELDGYTGPLYLISSGTPTVSYIEY